jgi:hypothetical protein
LSALSLFDGAFESSRKQKKGSWSQKSKDRLVRCFKHEWVDGW